MNNDRDQRLVGVLLAGGSGTRMRPLTLHMNKHLIPVYMRPMIEYPLGTLLGMGIREILIVTGSRHVDAIRTVLGSGDAYGPGVTFTYQVQDDALGIAHALSLAGDFARGRRVAVMLGDNLIDDDGIFAAARAFASAAPPYALNFLARVEDPSAYGVARVEGDRIVEVIEKPEVPVSDLAVTGLYLYPPCVFDKIGDLEPSARGELEITDINNAYVRAGLLRHAIVEHWFDAGEPGPWMRTQQYVESNPARFTERRFRLREPS